MLIDILKTNKVTAMKERNGIKSKLLSYVIAEAIKKAMANPKNPQKNPSDDDVIKTIEKSMQGNLENLAIESLDEKHRTECLTENQILEEFLPKKLSEEELKNTISKFLEENKDSNIGSIMKYLKQNYEGKYDGNKASQIIKFLLSNPIEK